MQKTVQLGLVVILAVSVNVEHRVSGLLASPCSNIEGLVGTGNSLDYFGIGEPTLLVCRGPGATIYRPINIVIRVEQLNKLRQTRLPPFREVIFARKSSPRARGRARLNLSGNSWSPLIWDVLT